MCEGGTGWDWGCGAVVDSGGGVGRGLQDADFGVEVAAVGVEPGF